MQCLPAAGFIRQAQLIGDPKADPPVHGIVPVGSSTLWRWVAAGKFPAPVKLSERVTAWRAADVQAWADAQCSETQQAAA